MIFRIHGACAGTEPIEGTHHLSFSIEHNGLHYFIDAGESCAYTAYVGGMNIAKTRAVFISHTHMDHVGGLANLLWYIRKVNVQLGHETCPKIDIFIPNLETFDGIMKILKNTEGNFGIKFEIEPHEVRDGVLYDLDDFKVTAYHNTHLPHKDGEAWRSFCYLIECEGKRILFTGDYGAVSDFADICDDSIDILLIETGHHSSEKTSNALLEAGVRPKKLLYIHNGKDVRDEPENAIAITEKTLGIPTGVLHDNDTFEL